MPMKPESLAFLRQIGTPPEALDILASDCAATITGDALAAYLRASYHAGRQSMRDHFVWHSVADLVDGPRA